MRGYSTAWVQTLKHLSVGWLLRGTHMAAEIFTFRGIKTQLEELTPTEFQDLKTTYYYRWVRMLLRNNGWLNLFLGVVSAWLGFDGIGQSIFSLIQAILGIVIIGQSIWSLRTTNIANIRRFSIVFLACGIWNVILAARGNVQGVAFWIGMLAVAQLWSAFRFQKIYKQYAHVTLVKPSPQAEIFYDSIWREIAKGVIEGDENYIEMLIQRRRWRGLLLQDRMVLAFTQRPLVILGDKADVVLVPTNPRAFGKWIEVVFKFDIIASAVGKIQRSTFEKYIEWKGGATKMVDAPRELRQTRNMRRTVRIVSIRVLGAIIYIILSMIAFVSRYA
jgi:hypothetical protein